MKDDIEKLREIHEKIRQVLIDHGNEEQGDCIIDEICEVVGIPPTTVYYVEGE
jgi:predicted metal-dependent TIM-barrel fold hydrolase